MKKCLTLQYNTENIIGFDYLIFVNIVIFSIIMGFLLYLRTGNGWLATAVIFGFILVTCFKPLGNCLVLIIHLKIIIKLRAVINSSNLVDYVNYYDGVKSKRTIEKGVKIQYKENIEKILITFYPNGITHSDNVYLLAKRISEVFGKSSFITKQDVNSVTYCMLKNNEQPRVDENEF